MSPRLFELVLVHSARDDHHPDEEDGADDPEGEDGLPALTCNIISIKSSKTIPSPIFAPSIALPPLSKLPIHLSLEFSRLLHHFEKE